MFSGQRFAIIAMFFSKGGGGHVRIQIFWGFLFVLFLFGHFSRKRGGLLIPNFWRGYLILKTWGTLMLFWFKHYPRKMWEDDKTPNSLWNFNPYKIRFLKSSLKHFNKNVHVPKMQHNTSNTFWELFCPSVLCSFVLLSFCSFVLLSTIW